MKRFALYLALIVCASALFIEGAAARATMGMKEGKIEFKSMGPLAFGPDGILFVADPKAAAIVAISTGDVKPAAGSALLKVEAINQKIAALLGTSADQILIEDMAINPLSRHAYLAVSRGRGWVGRCSSAPRSCWICASSWRSMAKTSSDSPPEPSGPCCDMTSTPWRRRGGAPTPPRRVVSS